MKELLYECKLQLEYLNQKFGETGTTNALLSKITTALNSDDINDSDIVFKDNVNMLNYPHKQLDMFKDFEKDK